MFGVEIRMSTDVCVFFLLLLLVSSAWVELSSDNIMLVVFVYSYPRRARISSRFCATDTTATTNKKLWTTDHSEPFATLSI